MFVDRLNTKSMLQRRHLNSAHNTLYVLCDQQVEEDISHLFFGCGFAQSCWQRIGFNWTNIDDIHDRLATTQAQMHLPFFMEAFIIAARELWNHRNGIIFDGDSVSVQAWAVRFRQQLLLQLNRFREESQHLVSQWLESVL